jgi:hypothetical protein
MKLKNPGTKIDVTIINTIITRSGPSLMILFFMRSEAILSENSAVTVREVVSLLLLELISSMAIAPYSAIPPRSGR